MNVGTHLKFEVLRTFRNRGFLIVTLALPLVLYCAVTPGNKSKHAMVENMPFELYFMTGMAAYGALFAVFSPTTRIALDRQRGWGRQTRVTPLRAGTYLSAKVATAFLVALPCLALLYIAGTAFGVRMSASQWLEMTGLLLLGLIPFIIMGITVGHLAKAESMPAVIGGLVVVFALFGGAFGEFFNSGATLKVIKLLPSYWLCQSGKVAKGSGGWAAEGWIVVAVWTAVMIAVAIPAYRRDTRRA
ncbi:MAG: ABC transporter permease [Catenulispora sp.]|nr:ABC transporter permease [Catenulispora sp.]